MVKRPDSGEPYGYNPILHLLYFDFIEVRIGSLYGII